MVYIKRAYDITQQGNSELLSELFGAVQSPSGERVNSETVFALPAFLNGVRLIASSIARADCHIYKSLPDGGRVIDDRHYVNDLLCRMPNHWQTYFSFMQTLVSNALWSGNGYAYIERDEMGLGLGLYLLDPRDVYTVTEISEGRIANLYYVINSPEGQIPLLSDDVIHIKNISRYHGVDGISIVDQLRMVLGKALAIHKFASLYFRQGQHYDRILKIPGWLNQEQQDQLRQSMATNHGGLSKSHSLSVLMGGTDMTTLPVSAEDMQLIEASSATITDIANILGIPGTKLGDRGAISYGSLEQDNLSALSDTYDSWFTQIEAELTCKLLRHHERKKNVSFDRNSLFVTDPSYARSQAELHERGAISWQELRRRLKLTTDSDGRFIIQSGFAVFDPKENKPPEPPAPVEPTDDAPVDDTASEDVTDDTAERARMLTLSSLKRIQKRIAKSVEAGKTELSDHLNIIRDNLAGSDITPVLDDLLTMQDEINSVLPEQQKEVIERWNIEQLAHKLF
jgi:HK97 family phage portal protein